jgi:hypothetical protein
VGETVDAGTVTGQSGRVSGYDRRDETTSNLEPNVSRLCLQITREPRNDPDSTTRCPLLLGQWLQLRGWRHQGVTTRPIVGVSVAESMPNLLGTPFESMADNMRTM